MCDNNFASLDASLFSRRCLAASTSPFPHAAMNLRPPSVTVSTRASASNAVAFQSTAMANARMLFCSQSFHYFSPYTLSSPHCTLKVSHHDLLCPPPAAHSDERPRPQTSSRAQRYVNTLTPGYRKGAVKRSHPLVWYPALCPDDAKPGLVVYGAEYGVVLLAKRPRTASKQEGLDCLGLCHSGLEGERYFRLVVELTT